METEPLLKWHRKLGDDPGSRAELRRCHDPQDAAFVPAFHWLAASMGETDRRRLALVATLAARVKANDASRTLAAACTGRITPNRFRRVLECEEREDLHDQLRNVIDILDGRVNLGDLAESVYFWGPDVRRRWATDYFSAGGGK